MRVLEFETKALLRSRGLSLPRGDVVISGPEALATARALGGPVVLKAQVPTGRRMKAGGVLFAATPEESSNLAESLLGRSINGFLVDRILVEERIAAEQEVFLAASYDRTNKRATLIASAAGGINVELAERVIRREFSTRYSPPDYLGREVAADLGLQGQGVNELGDVILDVARYFSNWDALLLELNPIVKDPKGHWWVADAHLELDDDAAFRQAELWRQVPRSTEWAQRRSKIERLAREIDDKDHRGVAGRMIAFDGDLGLLVGGGGASLTIMDSMLDAGLKPANYCEIGGNPSVWKVKELTKLVLGLPRVRKIAVIMNVVSNTRVDLVARGVIKGVLESGREPREVIAAFRIPGSWEAEGQAILRHYNVPSFGRETSIDQVVDAIRCQF